MATVLCICDQCYTSFYCKDELYAPLSKNNFRLAKGKKVPTTWQDWLEHISTNCEECRLKNIPTSCLMDYERLTKNS